MTTTTQRALLTAEEFFAQPDPLDGSKQELVRGKVVTMPGPDIEHGEVQANIAFLFKAFLNQTPIGREMTESGAVTDRKPDTVRGPDLRYSSKERLPLDNRVVGYHTEAPDLCVEIVSPSNSMKGLKAKAKEYLFAGVRLDC
ncbi:MAG: Uma2 family endonuclease [Planctomycetes bacterium]|nr:Uma2 family endonuclease [Planctomycetota bacterium]